MSIETYEPAPSRALDSSGSRIEFLRERVERAPTLINGFLERTIMEFTAVALVLGRGGREIFPKEGVVDVPYTSDDKIKTWGWASQRNARRGTNGASARARKMNFLFYFTYHLH